MSPDYSQRGFGRWLSGQAERNDPVGDLARDLNTPCEHRRPTTPSAVRAELERHSACPGAFDALDRAIAEWSGAPVIVSSPPIGYDALAVLVPMLGRAHRVAPLLESIESATPGARVVFMVTPGDTAVRDAIERAGREQLPVDHRPVGDYARKINTGYRHTTEPLLFTAADDLHFHQGWFEAAVRAMEPGIGVVGTNDLGNPRSIAGEHATHFLVSRAYADDHGTVDGPGAIFAEVYPHEFVDDELVGTAKHRGAWAMASDAIVEHLHPNWGKAPSDPVYERQRIRMRRGRPIFERRRHRWM